MTFRPIQQYKIAVSGTASSSQAIAEYAKIQSLGIDAQAVFYAKGCDIVYKLDDVSVTASPVATSNKLVAGNVMIAQGAIMTNLAGGNISAIAEDGSSTGTLYVTIGYDTPGTVG